MSVARLLPSGGANDFNVAITDVYTSVTFTKEYSPGAYTITATGSDTTFDIYAYNASGSLAGYTNTASLTATIGFNKLVIIGHTAGVLLSFTYKTTYTTVADNDEVTAGPFILSATATSLPSINNSTTITGGNFASNITATFTGTGYAETSAKSVTRNSVTSVVVVRPDSLPVSGNPYTLKLSNPGVTNPTGSNSHLLTVNAGSVPVWNTATTLSTRYTKNVSYTTTVSATDPDGGTIEYSAVGSLPGTFTVNSTSGVVSGTSSSTTNLTFTIRATDQGGNYTDRTFTLLNALPVWTTTSLSNIGVDGAVSIQVTATDDGTISSYSVASGSLPTGLSISSSGLITGTPTVVATYSFSLRATDDAGGTTDQAFTWTVTPTVIFLVVGGGGGGGGGWANPSNRQGGGGGAGGLRTSFGSVSGRGSAIESPLAITLGANYGVTIGGGGGVGGGQGSIGGNGGNTTFASITSNGGGGGGFSTNGTGASGGCGGGGGSEGGAGGAGTANQGYDGDAANGSNAGGSGGGAAGVNNSTDPSGTGLANSITGSSYTYSKGGYGAYINGGGAAGTNYGDGGAGTYEGSQGSGGIGGIVVLRYRDSVTCNIGGGLSGSTNNLGNGFKVTTIVGGSGNVSWS